MREQRDSHPAATGRAGSSSLSHPLQVHLTPNPSSHSEMASRSLPDYCLSLCFQVSVDISSGAIRVAVLEGSSQHVLMEGKLTHKINTESSLWSLEPGKCVLVRVVYTSCVSLARGSPTLDLGNWSSWKFEPALDVSGFACPTSGSACPASGSCCPCLCAVPCLLLLSCLSGCWLGSTSVRLGKGVPSSSCGGAAQPLLGAGRCPQSRCWSCTPGLADSAFQLSWPHSDPSILAGACSPPFLSVLPWDSYLPCLMWTLWFLLCLQQACGLLCACCPKSSLSRWSASAQLCITGGFPAPSLISDVLQMCRLRM